MLLFLFLHDTWQNTTMHTQNTGLMARPSIAPIFARSCWYYPVTGDLAFIAVNLIALHQTIPASTWKATVTVIG